MPSNEISVLADCIKFDLTTKETNGSRFGFMVLLKVLPLQAEDMKCEDKRWILELIKGSVLGVGEFICVTCNISNSCSILITVAIICNKTQVEICASASQFMINGREWEWNNYTKLELLGENAILTQELLVNSTLIYLHLNEVIPGDNKAISFRAIDAGIDDAMSKATFMLVPGYGRNIDDSRLGFIFPAQNRNSWISIAGTVNTRDSHVLESFRNGRRGAGCEYEFVSGAPTLTKKYPKRLLGTFSDRSNKTTRTVLWGNFDNFSRISKCLGMSP
ncbi:unnamed protein product, partial [Mesorhabditis belari]|uniref:Uncharacterized protein n=1 Tax=Mesorhabditis belari TaxID=2138241 RepID=A0AAF3FIU3_9BILA